MSNDYTSRHVSKRCLMMLGMESLHWWYVGGWGSGAGAGCAGDQFLQWRAERRHQAVTRHCGTTAVQSHAALMSRHTVYSHT